VKQMRIMKLIGIGRKKSINIKPVFQGDDKLITDDQIKSIGHLIDDINEEIRKADEIGHIKKVIDLTSKLSGVYEVVEILGVEYKIRTRII